MDRSCLRHESSGLKPDWLGDIKLFSVMNSYMLLYNILSNIFPATGSKDIGRQFYKFCISLSVCAGTTLVFFHSVGNFSFSRHDQKINSIGLQIEASQIFIIRILITSWPCALFGSRCLIIFTMSSLVKWIVDNNLYVFFERTKGRSLFVFIKVI